MSKAENRAYEAYPKMSRISEPHGLIPVDNKSHYLGDGNEEKREGFIKGYSQAEKDNELTWNDVALILNMAEEFNRKNTVPISDEEYFKEILKRFKDYKK